MTEVSIEAGTTARCAYHPESNAEGICDRCGSYHCASCYKQLAGKRLCAACLQKPGMDYLAETRAKLWGKRDFWVWYFGAFSGLGALWNVIHYFRDGRHAVAAISLLNLGLSIAYFMLVPWSRRAIFLLWPLVIVITQLLNDEPASERMKGLLGSLGATSMFLGSFLVIAWFSARNRLAFELPVSDRALARHYDLYLSNPNATRALRFGLGSLLVPLLIPVAFVFGVLGLRRAKPNAWPPVKGRIVAVGGMLLACLAIVVWSALFMLWTLL